MPAPVLVNRTSIVGAVEIRCGQPDQNTSTTGQRECIGAVLHQFQQLAVGVPAACRILLVVSVLADQIRLPFIGRECLIRL